MKWKTVDPIPRFETVLREQGISQETLDQHRDEAKRVIADAIAFAESSAAPSPESVADFVFA